MPNSGDSLQPQDPRSPVFQDGEFWGRDGLIRNVLWRLNKQESLSIVGGPKLGKTSFLLRLKWLLNSSSPSPRKADSLAVYFDLNDKADCDRLPSRSEHDQGIVMLDNCDSLLDESPLSLFDILCIQKGRVIFSGERKWKVFVESGGLHRSVRTIPLAVFLGKEALQAFSPSLSLEQKAWVLSHGGTHPFLLNLLQSEILSGAPHSHMEQTLVKVKNACIDFFARCAAQLQDPIERNVLNYLIEVSRPVNPSDVAHRLGVETIKPAADMLCNLGLISRWIRGEEATLSAETRLFNEWYQETFVSRSDMGL